MVICLGIIHGLRLSSDRELIFDQCDLSFSFSNGILATGDL